MIVELGFAVRTSRAVMVLLVAGTVVVVVMVFFVAGTAVVVVMVLFVAGTAVVVMVLLVAGAIVRVFVFTHVQIGRAHV